MEDTQKEFKKIKTYLYDTQLNTETSAEFKELVKLREVSDELRETLILLHSNYKAEFQAIKNHNLKILSDILDVNTDAFEKVFIKQKELDKIIDNISISKKGKYSNITRPVWILGSAALFIFTIWGLFSIDKETAKLVIELFKAINL